MLNVEPSFVLYALLLEPGGWLRARITSLNLLSLEKKTALMGRLASHIISIVCLLPKLANQSALLQPHTQHTIACGDSAF